MSKRIAILLLAALAGGFLFYLLPPAEPSYQGKPLALWIRGLESINANPTEEQRTALRAMGEPAVTRLIDLLQSHDSAIKQKFVAYARQHAGIYNCFIAPHRVIPEQTYHEEAATALGEIGPEARAAIPALIFASKGSNYLVAARAKAALIKIRQESIAPLLTALADQYSAKWPEAAVAARFLGPNAEEAVPLLIKGLQSTNTGIRQYAAMALQGIARRPDLVVPALIVCLQDKDAGIRRITIEALCEFKGEKQKIVPCLLSQLQDPDNNIWLGAAFGLERLLDPKEMKTLYVPALVQCLKSPSGTIRANAGMFLQRNDPQAAVKAGIQ